jgi:hypothetical protein
MFPKQAVSVRSRAHHFCLKAAECLQLAEIAEDPETKRVYTHLAMTYEQLATHADSIEKHHSEYKRLHGLA